ncbi:putative squalene monooxygenase [Medicago truncatula]|uniref:Squalene monooxygenase n=1 Tax=Medicago truncatula TaxID=3880 RepID=A0A396HCG2_MEDTR|nr:putative squalene monooxygenase [Medicago truncatula]
MGSQPRLTNLLFTTLLSVDLIFCSVKLEQGTVTSLVEKNGSIVGVNYKNKSGQEFTEKAPLTIVCDGCFSNLRSSLCKPKVIEFLFYGIFFFLS